MKNVKCVIILAGFVLAALLISCGGNTTNADDMGMEYTSEYVCPMHCDGSGSDDEGKCPVCGMDYVLNEEHQADGHKHEDAHEEHNH